MISDAGELRGGNGLEEVLQTLARQSRADRAHAKAMPGRFYLSEEFTALEQQRLFARGWVALCHEGELPAPGDYLVTELFDEPLLVLRDREGRPRIFSNVCRHRGMLLAAGRGNARTLTCPYHGWTYRDDGGLVGAPFMREVASFGRNACRLPEFDAASWGGFLFANLSGDAEPLAERLAPLEPMIANHHMSEMRHRFSEELIWNTNWKALVENFMEGYHLSVVHPASLGSITPTRLCEHFSAGQWYMGYRSWYPPACPERGASHPDLTEEQRRHSLMLCIYPGLLIGLCPHQILYMSVRPSGAEKVKVRWGLAVHGDIAEDELALRLDLYRRVNNEDKTQLERLMRGLASAHYEPGPLAPEDYEGTIRDLWTFIAREVLSAVHGPGIPDVGGQGTDPMRAW